MKTLSIETEELVEFLDKLVRISSKSRNARGNNDLQKLIRNFLYSIGMDVRIIENEEFGSSLIAETTAFQNKTVSPILLITHTDTVQSVEDWQSEGIEIGRFSDFFQGPGSYDSKAALVQICLALKLIAKQGNLNELPIQVLLIPDEQIGSPSSNETRLELSCEAAAVLIFGSKQTHKEQTAKFKTHCKGGGAHCFEEKVFLPDLQESIQMTVDFLLNYSN